MLALFLILVGCFCIGVSYARKRSVTNAASVYGYNPILKQPTVRSAKELLEILVQTLNERDYARIGTYLDNEIRVGSFSGTTGHRILREIVDNYPRHIYGFEIISEQTEAAGTRIFSSFRTSDGDQKYDFLITPEGQFRELNIVIVGSDFTAGQFSFPSEMEIPFQRIGKLILVQASVDGKPGLFLVDSGSDHMALNSVHFSLDTTPPQALSLDIGGMKLFSGSTHIREFKLEDLLIRDFDVSVQNLTSLEEVLGIHLLGIIGQSQLVRFETKFDFATQKMTLYSLDDCGNRLNSSKATYACSEMPFELLRHLPLIQITVGNETLKVALDSGVTIDVLDANLEDRIGRFARFNEIKEVIGLNGIRTQSSIYTVDRMLIDERRLENIVIAFIDFKGIIESIDYPLAGLLSFDVFADNPFSINYKRRKIAIFKPNG